MSRLYAADGRLLASMPHEKRVFVPVAAMPRRVPGTFVAAEDQRFFTHPGIDFIGVARDDRQRDQSRKAAGRRLRITQGRQELPAPKQATACARFARAILAFRIEETYSKERILRTLPERNLSRSGNHGWHRRRSHFDRSLDELSLVPEIA